MEFSLTFPMLSVICCIALVLAVKDDPFSYSKHAGALDLSKTQLAYFRHRRSASFQSYMTEDNSNRAAKVGPTRKMDKLDYKTKSENKKSKKSKLVANRILKELNSERKKLTNSAKKAGRKVKSLCKKLKIC